MTGFKVEYSELAIESLKKLQRYIARELFNPDAAKRQADRIMSACVSLSVFPKMHRIRKIDSQGYGLRFFPVDNYIVIYRVDEFVKTVTIMNVVYSRRNLDAII